MIHYSPVDFTRAEDLRAAAYLHELAPVQWNPAHVVEEEKLAHWLKYLAKVGIDGSALILLARDGAEMVATHWVRVDPDPRSGELVAHIQSLMVLESHRRRGIAAELKRRGEEWARARGAKRISTHVFYSNRTMIDFNVKLGFEPQQVEMVKRL